MGIIYQLFINYLLVGSGFDFYTNNRILDLDVFVLKETVIVI